jgi:ketosteroid isomerase-like protein
MDNQAIVRSFFTSWGVQDAELAAMHFHDDIVYELHIAREALPFGGVTRGKAACRVVLFAILKDFDYLKYEPSIVGAEGDIVRAQVSFKYLHRPSGESLEGTRRLVFRLRDGLIIRIDGYHDTEMVEAFVRLARHREATNQNAPPLVLPKAPRGERCI